MDKTSHALALITGASSGIGFELAREFVRHGYDVFVTADDELLDDAVARLQPYGTRVHSARVDLAAADGAETLLAELRALGRPASTAGGRSRTAVEATSDRAPARSRGSSDPWEPGIHPPAPREGGARAMTVTVRPRACAHSGTLLRAST